MDENDQFDPSGELTPAKDVVQTPELHSLATTDPLAALPPDVATPTEAEFSDFNPSYVTPEKDISKQIDQSAHDLYAAYKGGRVDLPQSWVKDLEKQSDDGTKPSDSLVKWLGTVAKLSLLSSPPALALKAGELAVSPQARADASKFISDQVVAPVATGANALAKVGQLASDITHPLQHLNPTDLKRDAETEKELAYGPVSGIAGMGEAGYDLATGFANIAQEGTPGAEERRIAGNVAAANLHHDLAKARLAATDALNINPDDPLTKTTEFLSQAALPIGIEGKTAGAIAKASDFLVDQTPKAIGKGLQAVGATGKALTLPAIAAGTAAAGHPAYALGELLTGYSGTWAGRMRKAILDKTFGKISDLGAKLASTPDNVTIIGGLRNEALNKAESLSNVEQTLRAKYAGKLEHVDDPNFDIEQLTGPDKQVRQAMDDAKEFQQRADSLKFYEDVNKIMSSGAKLATNISGQSAVTGAVVSAITAAQAQPEDVGKASEGGFRAGQLLGLPGAAIGSPGAMRDLRAARNADALAQIGKGAIAGSPDFEAHNENINRLDPKEQRRIDVLNGMGAPLGVKTILLTPEQLLQKSIATEGGQAPEVIGEKPPKQGGPPVAPNAIIDGNNIYLNSEQGAGPWGHEITHAIEKTLGQGAVKAMSTIGDRVANPATSPEYKDFAARYLEAMQKTIANYPALSNGQISSEAFAEIGRRVLHETPPELFYGGESGGDVLGRWANHIAGKLAPDWYNSLKTDPVFGAPYSKADIQNVKGALFELGSKAARGAKPPGEVAQPTAPVKPIVPVPEGAVKALISMGSDKATAQARVQAAVGDVTAAGQEVTLENVVRAAMKRNVPKDIAASPTTKVTPPPVQAPIESAEIPPPQFEETADGFKFMPVTRDGITSPAVQTDDGMIFKGKTHAEAERAAKDFGAKNPVRGFVNRKGFMTPDEASTQGVQTGQLPQGMEEGPLSVNGFNKNRQFMPRVSPMGFFSNLEKTIEERMPKRASAAQVRGIISGLKKEEIQWSGINDFLDKNPQVTKEQVMEFLRENNLSPTEILKGAGERERFEVDPAGIEKAYAYLEDNGYNQDDLHHNYDDIEIVTKANDLLENEADKNAGKYGAHVLPGGKNYRELLLTLPNKDSKDAEWDKFYQSMEKKYGRGFLNRELTMDERDQNAKFYNAAREHNFTGSHFSEPNIVAHVRFNDRTGPDGEKILHIEETQSDWHAQGRKKGYGSTEATRYRLEHKDTGSVAGVYDTREAAEAEAKQHKNLIVTPVTRTIQGVPDAPFKQTWPALAMKRMIRYAAEHGYDKLTWTTGDQQAARYDLSKHISKLHVGDMADGSYTVIAEDHNGQEVIDKRVASDKLDETVGKDLAARIRQDVTKDGAKTYSGLDLKIGGEWAKNLYDKTLVNTANDLGKRFGAKAGKTELAGTNPNLEEDYARAYNIEPTDNGFRWYDDDKNPRSPEFETVEQAQDWYDKGPGETVVHSLPITPEMRKSVMEKGQRLFMPPSGDLSTAELEAQHRFDAELPLAQRADLRKAKTVTSTPAFKKWFGGSKMVNSKGEPLVLYHQTEAEADPGILQTGFDLNHNIHRGNELAMPDGVFLKTTPKPIGLHRTGPSTASQIPLYAKIENPKVFANREAAFKWAEEKSPEWKQQLDRFREVHLKWHFLFDPTWSHEELVAKSKEREDELVAAATPAREILTKLLKDRGYDGVILNRDQGGKEGKEVVKTYVALDPKQVKSALFNHGTFDPSDPRIQFMPPAEVPKESARRIRENGGITVNLQGDEPTKGYAFSPLKNMEAKYPVGSLNEDNIRQYLRDHRDALSQTGAHIGGWDNGQGQAVLDVSVVHPDKLQALVRAKNASQDAIYDLASHKEIPTNEGLNEYSPEQIAAAEKQLNPPQQDTAGGMEGLRGSSSGGVQTERPLEKAAVEPPSWLLHFMPKTDFAAGEPPELAPEFNKPDKKRILSAAQDSKGRWVVEELVNVGGGEMGVVRIPGGPYPDEATATAAAKQMQGGGTAEPPSWLLHFMPNAEEHRSPLAPNPRRELPEGPRSPLAPDRTDLPEGPRSPLAPDAPRELPEGPLSPLAPRPKAPLSGAEVGSKPEPPSWLLHFMPSTRPDAVKGPAVKYKDGSVRAMRFHYEFPEKPGQIDGYLLNNGKFVDKIEALAHAEKIGQVVNYKPINPAQSYTESKQLESLAFKEQRKFMPKSDWWDHAQQYLTPEERNSIRDEGIAKITKLFSKLSPEKGADLALKGAIKKDWYRNSAQEISNIFGPDANRFAGLLASLSPQKPPSIDMRNALNVWAGWLEAGRPTDPATIKDIIGREVEQDLKTKENSAFPAWIPNAIRALTAEDASLTKLSGPKVDSFYRNLTDNVNEVTQDRWMQYYATGTKAPFKARRLAADEGRATKGFDYLALNAHIREVADLLTKQTGEKWTPSETQAAIWSYIKPLSEKAEKLGITPEELVKGAGLSKEDILARAQDFSDILKANENQPKLQRIKAAAPADFQGLPARAKTGSSQGLAGAGIQATGPTTKASGVKFMPSGVTPTEEIPKRSYPVSLAELNGHAGQIMAERAALMNYDGFSVKQPDGSTKYFKIDTDELLGNDKKFMPASVPPELQLSPENQKNIDDLTQKVRILNNQLQRYAATSAQPTLWDSPAAIKLSAQKQEMWNEIHKLRAGTVRDLVIIGSGPAGLTAAMNAGYDTVDTVLLEKQARLGGAPKDSSRIENTFGAAREGSTGQQLVRDAVEKARNNGAEIRAGVGMAKLEANTPVAGIHKITTTAHETLYARHVLLSPGLTFDRLKVPGGEYAISGNGRLAAIQAKGGTEIIVGGGNSASQAAIGAVEGGGVKHVYLFARSGLGKMTVSQAEQLEVNGNIQVVKEEIAKIDKVDGKLVVTSKQGHVYEVNSVGTFIGGKVDTQGLPEGIQINQEKGEDQGKVMVDPKTFETNVPGIFVAGDAATGSEGGGINLAVGSGAKVARVVSRRVYDAKKAGTYK